MWSKVEDGTDDDDTYIRRITNEVLLREDDRTVENCAFIVTIVNLMFDPSIRTTTLTSKLIRKKLNEFLEKSADDDDDIESEDDDENRTSDNSNDHNDEEKKTA